jgi:CRP-like cAMP-binding protein
MMWKSWRLDKMIDVNSLSQNKLFAHLNPRELKLLADQSQICRRQPGEWLVHAGEIWPYLFWIKSGEITALKESYEGRSLMLATISTGEVFWGLAFFTEDAEMPAALRVSQECELLLWSRKTMLPVLLQDGRMSWELTQLIVKRALMASEIVEKLAFQSVAGRLARFLLEQSAGTETERLSRELTLDEIAARIGSTREMVCRFLHRFADEGLIDITRTEFSLTNRKGLEDLALKVKG